MSAPGPDYLLFLPAAGAAAAVPFVDGWDAFSFFAPSFLGFFGSRPPLAMSFPFLGQAGHREGYAHLRPRTNTHLSDVAVERTRWDSADHRRPVSAFAWVLP